MQTENNNFPDKSLDSILEVLAKTTDEPQGDHLTDVDLLRFIEGDCGPEELDQFELHLLSCRECIENIEEMAKIKEQVENDESQLDEVYDKLMQRLSKKKEITILNLLEDFVFENRELPIAAGHDDFYTQMEKGSTEGESINWAILKNKTDDLIIRFESRIMELDGVEFAVVGGDPEVVLSKFVFEKGKDHVVARVEIARAEGEKFPRIRVKSLE